MQVIGMGNTGSINVEMPSGYCNTDLQKVKTAVDHVKNVRAISKVQTMQFI